MRVAVSTVAFPRVALAHLPQAARAVDAEGIALSVASGGVLPPDAPPAIVESFGRQCRDLGLSVSAIYSYAGRRLLDPATVAADIDLAKRCIDLAARLGAPVCRVFAGTERGAKTVIDRFVAACMPIADHAAGTGVILGFPTHHDLAFDPASCRRLVEGFGRARAGIIFTGPNLELDGISPLAALGEMPDLVEQVELKDWRHHGDHAHPVPIGAGEATVWPLVDALVAVRYGGWVTLHHLRQHHPELPPLDRGLGARLRAAFSKDPRS